MTDASFERCVAHVLAREGGYVNHKADRGGATNMGITQDVYTDWRFAHGMDFEDVRAISRAEAERIYFDRYWKPARCDDLPPSLRDVHFDAAVNHGVRRAALLLQDAACVSQDGVIGPQTLAAAHRLNPELLRARYIVARYRFYGQIVSRDRSQTAFIAGWMNRMAEFT